MTLKKGQCDQINQNDSRLIRMDQSRRCTDAELLSPGGYVSSLNIDLMSTAN